MVLERYLDLVHQVETAAHEAGRALLEGRVSDDLDGVLDPQAELEALPRRRARHRTARGETVPYVDVERPRQERLAERVRERHVAKDLS